MESAMTAAAAQAATRTPSRVRFAVFVFLGVYPLVTLGLGLLLPLTPDWPLAARTLVLVPVIVTAMVWGVIPFIQIRLRRFL
jgi:antibiotic biosynthesis monooxygenase (ABM) superfamily enzyme